MANEQNLRPSEYKFTKADYEKSQVSRQENAKRKRDIRLALEMLLEREYALEDGTVLTGAEAIALKQFEKALNDGDTKAFEVVRDTAGQKPVEKVAVGATNDAKNELAELLEQRRNAGQ